MGAKVEARVTHRFSTPAGQVYDAWLNPHDVRVWLAASLKEAGLAGELNRIEIDPRVGGMFFFSDLRNGAEARHWGTYLELDRPHTIVFTWIVNEADEADPSKVTLTIEPEANGCTATLVHEMDAKWAEYVDRTKSGWSRMLKAVDVLLHR
jgi:uncharacterized protein YndB with AHSA1/START domain